MATTDDDHTTHPDADEASGGPWWPEVEHPISELMSPVQGASSPYGEVEFPVPPDELGYEHPRTEINR